ARMIAAQGGDARVARDPDLLPRAERVVPVPAPASGYVASIDPLEIGLTAVAMGAGRTRVDQAVDPAVGIVLAASPGARVEVGEPLAHLHVRSEAAAAEVAPRVAAAFRIADEPPPERPLLIATIDHA
ncbi:MAG TPA: thymidine phosphorylase, partial [Minicystis sp.]|nr:thymidine phosphorylase [Minicystis sp.]